jgi:hypothetical protein
MSKRKIAAGLERDGCRGLHPAAWCEGENFWLKSVSSAMTFPD